MKAPVDFYFDFSSPYGYLASHKIDALAGKYGRAVTWRPRCELQKRRTKRDGR